jgi:hypothetical protein
VKGCLETVLLKTDSSALSGELNTSLVACSLATSLIQLSAVISHRKVTIRFNSWHVFRRGYQVTFRSGTHIRYLKTLYRAYPPPGLV